MREPKAFAELETKIGQEEKPANSKVKTADPKQEKPKYQLINKSVDKPVGTPTKGVSVRDWVKKNYPQEYQTDMIRGDLTFDDLGKAMESGDIKDFYSYASEGGKGFDSEVREEIFEGLSKHHGKPYDYYYDLWLNGPKEPANKEFSFAPDPTDPDLERGYGPRIKKVMYRGDDIQKAKDAGWSDDQIIDALIDQGYDDEEVIDFVTDYDPRRFKDPKTNPARSPEAWEEKAKNQEALRRKFGSTIFPPTKSMPYWTFDDPYWGGTRKFKTEEEALDYAGESLEKHNDWVSKEATRLINDFRQGKVTTKDLKQFGRSEYVADILTYLLGKIK